jgi:hypothetical protein
LTTEGGFREELQILLEKWYPHTVIKEYKRSWLLIEDSGTLISVNGSKIHGESSGWYDLDESIYKTIIATENSYLAIVFGRPEDTFVLPKRLVQDIFSHQPKMERELKNPRYGYCSSNFFICCNSYRHSEYLYDLN